MSRFKKPIHGHYVGKKASRTYRIWRNMRNRCERAYHSAYPYYGGAGIVVCERWKTFANFLADMGPVPDGMTIDRIDSKKNYEPENCRWATMKQQARNTKWNRLLTAYGKTQCIAAWAEELGIRATNIYSRLDRGCSAERALSSGDLRK